MAGKAIVGPGRDILEETAQLRRKLLAAERRKQRDVRVQAHAQLQARRARENARAPVSCGNWREDTARRYDDAISQMNELEQKNKRRELLRGTASFRHTRLRLVSWRSPLPNINSGPLYQAVLLQSISRKDFKSARSGSLRRLAALDPSLLPDF